MILSPCTARNMSCAGSRSSSSNHRATPSDVSSAARPVAAACAFRTSAIPAASCGVGARTASSVSCTQLLRPDVGLPEDAHARAFVEARRARGVLDVHPERDGRLTGPAEPPEGLVEEREAEAAAPPRGPHAERADEAPVAHSLRIVAREGDDLVTGPDDRHQRRVEARAAEDAVAPFVVADRGIAPLVRERLELRVVQSRAVAVGVERA